MATSSSSTTTTEAAAPKARRSDTGDAPVLVGVPPLAVSADPVAGEGVALVESPTGTRTVVDKAAVDHLKTQGYTVV